jgi:hypothetical protein
MASVDEYLAANPIIGAFKPYCVFSRQDDTLTAYFTGDEYFSERLTAHVTIFRAFGSLNIVGCRIKGVSEITRDLPNRIDVRMPKHTLSVVFEAVRENEASPEVAESFDRLGQLATESQLETVEC